MSNYPQENIKPYNQDESKAAQVEKMFDNIAPTYDNLNHVLSLGIDKSWRRKAINMLKPYRPMHMMDVATGTGDFAIQACRVLQPEELIGTDWTNRYPSPRKTVLLSHFPTTDSMP